MLEKKDNTTEQIKIESEKHKLKLYFREIELFLLVGALVEFWFLYSISFVSLCHLHHILYILLSRCHFEFYSYLIKILLWFQIDCSQWFLEDGGSG